MNLNLKFNNSAILFWLGVLGLAFYVIGPILFAGTAGIRQPELLPVYTLMMGLGQLSKSSSANATDKANKEE